MWQRWHCARGEPSAASDCSPGTSPSCQVNKPRVAWWRLEYHAAQLLSLPPLTAGQVIKAKLSGCWELTHEEGLLRSKVSPSWAQPKLLTNRTMSWINGCWFKLLKCGVICYTVKGNWYISILLTAELRSINEPWRQLVEVGCSANSYKILCEKESLVVHFWKPWAILPTWRVMAQIGILSLWEIPHLENKQTIT